MGIRRCDQCAVIANSAQRQPIIVDFQPSSEKRGLYDFVKLMMAVIDWKIDFNNFNAACSCVMDERLGRCSRSKSQHDIRLSLIHI